MNGVIEAIRDYIRQILRGPSVSRLLRSLGIDVRRYWLLIDLFSELSDRSEIMDQLGRDGVALKLAAWLYFGLSCILTFALLIGNAPFAVYASMFFFVTAFLLLTILVSETGNSLVNPVEGMILAHYPIDGATYTAAKLTHLLQIIVYFVPALNLAPALGGLLLEGSPWFYPIAHMMAALSVGLLMGLLCCALFGWLLRIVPARRLKAAGQLAAVVPFLGIGFGGRIAKWLALDQWAPRLPAEPLARWAIAAALVIVITAVVAAGIRSLSADYLIRISSITRGGSRARSKSRRAGFGPTGARWFGGQPGAAGFVFVSRMMLRDWQFRRQSIPALLPALMFLGPVLSGAWRVDPFTGAFTPMHFLPHMCGVLLFLFCTFLAFGSDYKGAWIFLVAPKRAMGGFARGVYWLLWTRIILIPHALMCPFLAWAWGLEHATLFLAYSVAVASVYLALELRLIEGAPFTKPFDPTRGSILLPLIIIGGIAMGIAVGLQYVLVFRSPAAVLIVTIVAAAIAFFLTRGSLRAFEESIRYNLGLMSEESGSLYREVN